MRKLVLIAFSLLLLTCSAHVREPGYVYYRLDSNPSTLDPALIVNLDDGLIAAKLFNGLLKLGDSLDIEADLAQSWSVSNNGLVYTFELKKGVGFSSGREVKAGDVKYSFERVLDPKTRSPNTWIFMNIKGSDEFVSGGADDVSGIAVLDSHKLEITLKEPFSPFLGLLTMPPAYIVPIEEVLHRGPDFATSPVGTGPYTLAKWEPGEKVVLKSRAGYFDRGAKLRGIVFRIVPEELTAVTEFELGNLDILTIPSAEYSRYRKSQTWKDYISSVNGINTYYLGLNCSRAPFDDPEVRRAMNMAIDRKKILATLHEGRGRLADGPVPDTLRNWPLDEHYEYNPAEARRILNAKGLGDRQITFYIKAEQQVVDIAEVIQHYLSEAGLNVVLRQLEWSAFKDAVNKGEADMFWLSWWADYPDPENFLFPLFHSSNIGPAGNRARYVNAEVDRNIELGQHAPTTEARDAYYALAENIIVHDAPWVFFWHRTDYTLRQPWVREFKIYPVYSMDKGLDIYIDKPST